MNQTIDKFPRYTLKMRGEAIRVIQEGYGEDVFDMESLWAEYRRVSFPNENDPTRRYVIEKAIEVFENKVPKYRENGSIVSQARRSPAVNRRSQRSRKVSLLRRIWNLIRGL